MNAFRGYGGTPPWQNHSMINARNVHLAPIELAVEGKTAPEWVALTPKGPLLAATDGRQHRLSRPDQVVAAFAQYGLPLPIDVEHATHVLATKGEPAPAYGWVREMEVRDGAVWARVEWTDQGAAWIVARAYKFLSPGYLVDEDSGEITSIISVGLTNTPGFKMAELAKLAPIKENNIMDKAVLEALGLASNATAADAVAKIKDLQGEVHTANAKAPDPAKFVPKAQLDAANAKLTGFEAAETARSEKVLTDAVDAGVAAGKIAPAAKDGFLAMARAQGVEAFTATVAAMPVVTASNVDLDAKDPAKKMTGKLSPDEISVARNMGLTDAEFIAAKKLEA